MKRLEVAVLDDYQAVASDLGPWDRIDGDVMFFSDHLTDRHDLVERLTPFDVIVAMRERTPFPADLLAELPDLQLLVTTGMRNAAIDLEAASQRGVTVVGTASPGHPTAELAFGFIQALARGLVVEVDSVRGGGWQAGLGRDLRGATLGLVGLGRLGTQVAGYAHAFGMEVVAWSQNLTADRAADVGVELVGFQRLLSVSDFVSIHLRLSDRTRGLIGAKQLALMRPGSYLVNTSRGPIVDTDALLAAVRNGVISGAATDVHDVEPLPEQHPIRHEPRILATPHIGYVTLETYQIFYRQAVEDIVAWQQGSPIRLLE